MRAAWSRPWRQWRPTKFAHAVFRTRQNELSEVLNVGRYIDEVVSTAEGLRFAARVCVFDSEMIPNSIIYPI